MSEYNETKYGARVQCREYTIKLEPNTHYKTHRHRNDKIERLYESISLRHLFPVTGNKGFLGGCAQASGLIVPSY